MHLNASVTSCRSRTKDPGEVGKYCSVESLRVAAKGLLTETWAGESGPGAGAWLANGLGTGDSSGGLRTTTSGAGAGSGEFIGSSGGSTKSAGVGVGAAAGSGAGDPGSSRTTCGPGAGAVVICREALGCSAGGRLTSRVGAGTGGLLSPTGARLGTSCKCLAPSSLCLCVGGRHKQPHQAVVYHTMRSCIEG